MLKNIFFNFYDAFNSEIKMKSQEEIINDQNGVANSAKFIKGADFTHKEDAHKMLTVDVDFLNSYTDWMRINDIIRVDKSKKEYLPVLQMFNTGFRTNFSKNQVSEINEETIIEGWNNCVFLDVDAKLYKGEFAKEFKETIENDKGLKNLVWNCQQLLPNNFFFAQKSISNQSLHLIYYFDCDQTYSNFLRANRVAESSFREAFSFIYNNQKGPLQKGIKNLGDKILNTANVLDNCSNRISQLLYLSNHKLWLSDYIHEENFEKCNFEDVTLEDNYIDSASGINTDEFEFLNLDINNIHLINADGIVNAAREGKLSHLGRLSLATVFAYLYGIENKQKAIQLYKEFVPIMANNISNHIGESGKLLNYFTSQYNGICTAINRGIIKISKFSLDLFTSSTGLQIRYDLVFQPLEEKFRRKTKHDKIISLSEDEYLDLDKIIAAAGPKSTIHVSAGCGTGKTRSVMNFVEQHKNDNIAITSRDNIFNVNATVSHKRGIRICYVAPITSILGNSFDPKPNDDEYVKQIKSNFIIIDSTHNKKNETRTSQLMNFNKSIVTTWDSFVLLGMNNSDYLFDYYIFDESHNIYMYDYRSQTTNSLIFDIKALMKNQKNLIFMSGTQGVELQQFNINSINIKIAKKQKKILANIKFYHTPNFWREIKKDMSFYLEQDKKNNVVIFMESANYELKEKLAMKYNINIDTVYCKRNIEDVQYVNANESTQGRVSLFSMYGMTGINLIMAENQTRIYVISKNAMNIIQAINRCRVRNKIDSVNIYILTVIQSIMATKKKRLILKRKIRWKLRC